MHNIVHALLDNNSVGCGSILCHDDDYNAFQHSGGCRRYLCLCRCCCQRAAIFGDTSGFSAEQTRSFIASLSDSGGIQIVVVADAKIVGWCDVTPVPFEGMRHVGRLGMGLLPSFRGQGLGRRLVREALSQVFAKTLQRVELEVFASNKIAVVLYEREGFVIEGRKRCARFLDGAEDDILIMGCLRDEWLCSTSQ